MNDPNSKNNLVISSKDAYELIKIQVIQDIEKDFFTKLKSKWSIFAGIAILFAAVFGYSSISMMIENKVTAEVTRKADSDFQRYNQKMYESMELGLNAKLASQDAQKKLSSMESSLVSMEKTISEQRNQIDSLASMIRTFYQNIKTEIFNPLSLEKGTLVQWNTLPHKDSPPSIANKKITYYFLMLDKIPIADSIRLNWNYFSFPFNDFYVNRNLIWFGWDNSDENLVFAQGGGFYITYSIDPKQFKHISRIEMKSDGLYADDELLYPRDFFFGQHRRDKLH